MVYTVRDSPDVYKMKTTLAEVGITCVLFHHDYREASARTRVARAGDRGVNEYFNNSGCLYEPTHEVRTSPRAKQTKQLT